MVAASPPLLYTIIYLIKLQNKFSTKIKLGAHSTRLPAIQFPGFRPPGTSTPKYGIHHQRELGGIPGKKPVTVSKLQTGFAGWG
jgi:hypothetical protein